MAKEKLTRSEQLSRQKSFVLRMNDFAKREKDEAFKKEFLSFLKEGYEDDLEILVLGITDPADPSRAKQGFVERKNGRKYLLCVTLPAYGGKLRAAGLSLQDMFLKDVIDRVLDADVYGGLLFDYGAATGSFCLEKAELKRAIRG